MWYFSILKSGNAVAQQAAGLGLALEHMHLVAGAGELLGGREAGGPEPMTATRLPVEPSAGSGLIQPISHALSAIACSMVLMVTGWFSRLSVQASSHGAGQMRPVNSGNCWWNGDCAPPPPSRRIDEIVPVRDLVVHRAARRPVAEGNAAIHAARRLLLQVAVVERQGELAEMANAFAGELILLLLPVVFEKACDLAHGLVLHSLFRRLQGPERSISWSARRYSTGMTFTNLVR